MGIFAKLSDSFRNLTNIDAHIDTNAADKSIRKNIEFKGPNAWILAIAIIIASIGLNVNSIPVIIGAMLISPLMGPIFGIGLGLGINDVNLMKQSGKNLFIMVFISLGVSLLYFMVTPLNLTDQSEIIARTRPTIFDVLIAFFGGLAGIFEQSRKDKGTVFSGVAIATALMPPLCTAGYGLATGQITFFLGALYLFCINCIFITLATYILVRYFKFKKADINESTSGKRIQRITSLFIAIFLIPSIWTAISLVKENNFEQKAALFVKNHSSFANSFIYNHEIEHADGSVLKIYLTGESLNETERNNLYACAKEYGIEQNQLIIKENSSGIDLDANSVFTSLTADIDHLESIIEQRNATIEQLNTTIAQLENELQAAQQKELPYANTASIISSQFPEVKQVYIGSGAQYCLEKEELSHYVLVTVKTDSLMTETSLEKVSSLVKASLKIENLQVDNKIVQYEPVEDDEETETEDPATEETEDVEPTEGTDESQSE